MLTWGSSMRWVLRLIETGMPSEVAGVDVMEISRPDGASNIADLGLGCPRRSSFWRACSKRLSPRKRETLRLGGQSVHLVGVGVRQRPAMPFARGTIRQSDSTAAAVSLRQLRSHRALRHLAIALSIDA
jgi:hypothetical protein